jgi:hypothetical protein
MNFDEFTGNKMKKLFGATRAFFNYHYHYKNGSGSFALILQFEHGGLVDVGCGMKAPNRSLFDINGTYTSQKVIHSLNFGTLYQIGSQGLEDMTMEEFTAYAKAYIKRTEAEKLQRAQEEKAKV